MAGWTAFHFLPLAWGYKGCAGAWYSIKPVARNEVEGGYEEGTSRTKPTSLLRKVKLKNVTIADDFYPVARDDRCFTAAARVRGTD